MLLFHFHIDCVSIFCFGGAFSRAQFSLLEFATNFTLVYETYLFIGNRTLRRLDTSSPDISSRTLRRLDTSSQDTSSLGHFVARKIQFQIVFDYSIRWIYQVSNVQLY